MTESEGEDQGRRMAHAVVEGIVKALPISYILLTAAIFFLTDRSFVVAAATAALPGILIGVFFGGFVGVTRTMD